MENRRFMYSAVDLLFGLNDQLHLSKKSVVDPREKPTAEDAEEEPNDDYRRLEHGLCVPLRLILLRSVLTTKFHLSKKSVLDPGRNQPQRKRRGRTECEHRDPKTLLSAAKAVLDRWGAFPDNATRVKHDDL